ncbi:MAG: hypothetical protein OEY11_11800, partial [Gammaproteobacteria bacterium]|nr:hypothetical protein [Gammaproteobacteria bacterium]
MMLGKRYGLNQDELHLLKQGTLMHDLSKIGITGGILNKTEAPDEHEFESMKKHPEMTVVIMRPLSRFKALCRSLAGIMSAGMVLVMLTGLK